MSISKNMFQEMRKNVNTTDKVVKIGLPERKTCPSMDECGKGNRCYTVKATIQYDNVAKYRNRNWRYTLLDDFVHRAQFCLEHVKPKRPKSRKLVVRVHDSGDFYNAEYADKWLELVSKNPEIEFYWYTKSVGLFLENYDRYPDNLRIIFSFGGKEDHLIDTSKHYHCHIFPKHFDPTDFGYLDASHDDMVTARGNSLKIGIAYHGPDKDEWYTFDPWAFRLNQEEEYKAILSKQNNWA